MNYVNKLLKAFNYSTKLTKALNFENKTYKALNCFKKWIGNIVPSDVLNIDLKESINLISTLSESGIFYEFFPETILTPNYGDNWGRFANYIEINNRAIA